MELEHRLIVAHSWDGIPCPNEETLQFDFGMVSDELLLHVEGPFRGDPAPPAPPSGTPGLWNYEVAELFLLGTNGHYVEVELGPAGHFLVLRLTRYRGPAVELSPLSVDSRILGGRFRASLRLGVEDLPPAPWRANAYAIHGVGSDRRYLAAYRIDGPGTVTPDFHRLSCFEALRS